MQNDDLFTEIHQKTKIFKFQDGGHRHIGFWKNAYNFRLAEAISLKFGTAMQNYDLFTEIHQKMKIFKFQDGGGRHIGFSKNAYSF